MIELFRDEKFRGWLYRLSVVLLFALVLILRPDDLDEWAPYLVGLFTGSMASLNTIIKRRS